MYIPKKKICKAKGNNIKISLIFINKLSRIEKISIILKTTIEIKIKEKKLKILVGVNNIISLRVLSPSLIVFK